MAFMRKTKQELEAALEKLDRAEERIQALEADVAALERVVGVMVLSPDGVIEKVSNIVAEELGYERYDLIGQHHRVLCGADYARSEDYIRFWRELVTGRAQQGCFEAVAANGKPVLLYARYSPVMSQKGLSERVLAVITGVDEKTSEA